RQCALSLSTHPPTPHLYPLSLHDALPISPTATRNNPIRSTSCCSRVGRRTKNPALIRRFAGVRFVLPPRAGAFWPRFVGIQARLDRKSTRLNSSHVEISYAVFCLKKKNTT